jgi:alpha-L-fucosidase
MDSNGFEATTESLRQHRVPDWYEDAKFGIFIHWTVSSVPAFAPAKTDINQLIKTHGPEVMFSRSPYSEWYLNSLRIKGSPVQQYHHDTYGSDYDYGSFAKTFNSEIKQWQPDSWSDLFKKIHARYVVLVTKHHDGFLMWPSAIAHPDRNNWHASRNIVGELTKSVRSRGLKMGYYYSGALDWSFTTEPITSFSTMLTNGPTSKTYARYVDQHYRELIDQYSPDVLWNDIAYPARGNLQSLIAYYYNKCKEGLINDRWQQVPTSLKWLLKLPYIRNRAEREIGKAFSEGSVPAPGNIHTDYSTPEYRTLTEISERKWECVRGIGHSFGYNSTEADENFLSGDDLVWLLIDIVSKNGNLLLNIGPKADGSIPEQQLKPLLELGEWLGLYGEAIFATRPFSKAVGETSQGDEVHFTRREQSVFVFIKLAGW